MSEQTFDLDKIAHLARLQLKVENRTHYCQELGKILNLVEQLNAVDTDGVEPLAHAIDVVQRGREDVADAAIDRDVLQSTATVVADGLYLAPKVIE